MSGRTGFAALPDELYILILSFLKHPRSLLNVSAVNCHLHQLVEDDSLWRALFLMYKHERTPHEEQESDFSFKTLFRQRFVLDRNWHQCSTFTTLPPNVGDPAWSERHRIPSQRPVQSIVAAGGRFPVMAVACARTQVHVYDLRSRRKMSVIPEEDARALVLILDAERVRDQSRRSTSGVSLGWGDNELRLVTGSKRLRVWKLPYRKGINPMSLEVTSRIRCMRAVDRTPLLLTGSVNGSVKLWNIEIGELVRSLEGFHDGVLCLGYHQSSSGESGGEPVILAVGGSGDCTAKIWDLKTGATKILSGHQQAVHRILVDQDIVIAGAMDSTVRTWRVDTGEPLCLFTTHKTVVSHMSLYASPVRSLLTICFDGVAAIHSLDQAPHHRPSIWSSLGKPMRLNIACSTVVDVEVDAPYVVIGTKDGTLSLFRLTQTDQGEDIRNDSQVLLLQPIRTIVTGLSPIYQICVMKSGIIVAGLSKYNGLLLLFYDFALEEQSQQLDKHH